MGQITFSADTVLPDNSLIYLTEEYLLEIHKKDPYLHHKKGLKPD